jgi:formamidase
MKTMLEIRIDRTKTLAEEPSTGHNRWHPDIPPIIRCDAGDEVVLTSPRTCRSPPATPCST